MTEGLRVEALRAGYGKTSVLHGITFDVTIGARTALVGMNGAGKSTTFRTISGLLRPRPGSVITFGGDDLTRLSTQEIVRRGVVQVPEGRRIFPEMTVDENLRIANFGRPKKRFSSNAERVYEVFPVLRTKRYEFAGLLSGGQQQMLALGRAVIAEPKLLLVDEMSLGLAPRLTREVYEKFDELFDSNVSMLIVEQNTSLAMRYCTHINVMRNGELVASSPAAEFAADRDRLAQLYVGGYNG